MKFAFYMIAAGLFGFAAAELSMVQFNVTNDEMDNRINDPVDKNLYYISKQTDEIFGRPGYFTRDGKIVVGNTACYVAKYNRAGDLIWSNLLPLNFSAARMELYSPDMVDTSDRVRGRICAHVTVDPTGRYLWLQASTNGTFADRLVAPPGKVSAFVFQLSAMDGQLSWVKTVADLELPMNAKFLVAYQPNAPVYDGVSNRLFVAFGGSHTDAIGISSVMVAALQLGESTQTPSIAWTQQFNGDKMLIQNWLFTPGASVIGRKIIIAGILIRNQNVFTVIDTDIFVARLNPQTGAIEEFQTFGGSGDDTIAYLELLDLGGFYSYGIDQSAIVYDSQHDSVFISGITESAVFSGFTTVKGIFVMRLPVQSISTPIWLKTFDGTYRFADPFLLWQPVTQELYALGALTNDKSSASFILSSSKNFNIFVAKINATSGDLSSFEVNGVAGERNGIIDAKFSSDTIISLLCVWSNALSRMQYNIRALTTETKVPSTTSSFSDFGDSFFAQIPYQTALLAVVCLLIASNLVICIGYSVLLTRTRRAPIKIDLERKLLTRGSSHTFVPLPGLAPTPIRQMLYPDSN
jgi:hypothetical protein